MASKPTERVILKMEHIVKEFPGVIALDDVNLTVHEQEIHAICGENGAGKSTLMKVLSGVHPSGTYRGTIEFDGKPVKFSNLKQSEEAGIAIIHQELALIPELSVAENMFLGNEITERGSINWGRTHAEAAKYLKMVGLDEDPETKIKDLGVGKQQLIEIAKALAKKCKLLILDEPTAALNEEESAHLLNIMRTQRDAGMTLIMISHKLNEIEEVSDAVTIIRDGKTIETLYVSSGDIDEDRIIRGMVGRSLDNRFPEREPELGDVIFEVRDWWVRHPINTERYVCKGSNLHVRAGEIVGIAGLMGAGRTELARSVFGKSYGIFERGEVYINGEKAKINSVRDAITQRIAYIPEDRKALGLNLLDPIMVSTISAKMKKVAPGGVIDWDSAAVRAEELRMRLRTKAPSVSTGVSTLSGGNQQKVVLSKWIFTDPDVLILDEPTRGIDVGAKYEIYTIIHALAAQGKAIIIISSELPEVLGMSDRIYTVFEGEITGQLDAADADQESLMRLMTSSTRPVA